MEIKKVVLMLQEIGERPFEDTSEFVLREGILYRRNYRPGRQYLLVVPSCMRQDLIREYHDMPVSGHHRREKTLARLSQRFYWRGMEKSVKHFVRSCSFCQLFKIRAVVRRVNCVQLNHLITSMSRLGLTISGLLR